MWELYKIDSSVIKICVRRVKCWLAAGGLQTGHRRRHLFDNYIFLDRERARWFILL